MNDTIDRATIDLARARLLNERDAAQERLAEASLKAALPGGDDQEMIAAEAEVSRINQKLAGLAHGLERVEAEERERQAAERLAQRRGAAVEILSLVHKRAWATDELDQALSAVERAIDEIETLGDDIKFKIKDWFDHERGGQGRINIFLAGIDAIDVTDTVYRVRKDIGHPGRYARGLPFNRPAALQALASALPEVRDEAVKQEALALARGGGAQ